MFSIDISTTTALTGECRICNALDYLMLSLIGHYRNNNQYRYFEFGTSMAEDGINLNEGLILQKENFGGRAVACKILSINIAESFDNASSMNLSV